MPELPEVEHARRVLRAALGDAPLLTARALDPIVVPNRPLTRFGATWEGARVASIERTGKHLLVCFTSDGPMPPDALWLHLGMTGSLVVVPRDPSLGAEAEAELDPAELPRFTRCWLATATHRVCLADPRKLGRAFAGPLGDVLERSGFAELGPDALDVVHGAPAGEALAACFESRTGRPLTGPIKAALMDQSRLAGLGNIHAVEALFDARIHPSRSVASLDDAAWEALATGIRGTLDRALAESDALLREGRALVYVSAGGPNPFRVYDREGEPCPRCGAPIVRTVDAARSTYFCAQCQPSPHATKPAKNDAKPAKNETRPAKNAAKNDTKPAKNDTKPTRPAKNAATINAKNTTKRNAKR